SSFIDLMLDAVIAVDSHANIVFASASCERIFGYTPAEMIGKNMFDMMLPEDREITRKSVVEIMSGNPQLNFENSYVHKSGHLVNIMWSTRWSEADQLRIGVARDVTERKRSELLQSAMYSISEAAHTAEDLLKLFQRIHEILGMLLKVDNFSVILYDAETAKLSFAYHVDEFQEAPAPLTLIPETFYAQVIHTGQPLLLTPETIKTRLKDIQISSGMNPFCWLGVPLKTHTSTIGMLMVQSYPGGVCYSEQDKELLQFVSTQIAMVIEHHQMQARLLYLAQYDQLTGLPNRSVLYDRLNSALLTARQQQGQLSLLFIDLDKFKQVNDTLGHSMGDLLLQEAAIRLKACVHESDTVARIGGDEFVILVMGKSFPDDSSRVANKIEDAFSSAFMLAGHHLLITPSIGIAHYPEHGNDEYQLLNYADNAMYLSKNSKRY
ncbi:TPA: diguanylate cyclase, partial [Klebsiella quasipneumoniae]|nr:diguanylate cyclase [Klebsiella quasipneumoniae]